jgi:dTDP-glucose 4,6-dehydratase
MVRYNSRADQGMIELIEPKLRAKIEVVAGDLRDGDFIRDAVKGVDLIFHLAALIDIPYSYNHPREVVETNLLGTLNLLKAAYKFRVKRFIHTSTSEVYGTAQTQKINESHPLVAQSPYAASKIGADKLVESFYLSYDLPVTTIRPFNTYGPRQSARAVIPTIIIQALSGSELVLGSLSPTRDFTFVSDLISAFLEIAEADEVLGQVINIGSGQEITIAALARQILELLGRDLPIRSDPARLRPPHSEVERLCCNPSRAKYLLGWMPKVPLSEGLRTTIEWFEAHLDRYR